MKLLRAFGKVTIHNLLLIIVSIFLVAPLNKLAESLPVIFSLITAIIYICTMYSLGWGFGYMDARNIPGYYPNKTFPVKVSLLCSIIPIILIILKVYCPDIWRTNFPVANGEMDFFLAGYRLHGTCDMICKFWFFPFGAFLKNDNILAFIVVFLIQPIFIYIGYIVGLTRFNISEKLFGFILFAKNGKKRK